MAKKIQNSEFRIEKSQKVWRIFRFEKRYELSEDVKICRKSGLLFTKRFVGAGGGDEAVGYHRQMAMICNGDGLQAALIEGLYGKLVDLTAEQSRHRRGYLLGAGDKPLTEAQLGKMLNINPQTMGKYLRLFESVALLEYVDTPDFEGTEGPQKKDGDTENPGSGAVNEGDFEPDREIPENSGKKRKPLKKRQAAKAAKDKGKRKQKATIGLSASGCEEKENGSAEAKVNAQEADKSEAQEPIADKPSESDAQGGEKARKGTDAPLGSIKQPEGQQRAGPVHHKGEYTESDLFLGRCVFDKIWPQKDPNGKFGTREITSFASKWHEIRCRLWNLPETEIDRLRRRGLTKAPKIAKICENKQHRELIKELGLKCKSNNPAKIWNALMTKIAVSMKKDKP